MSRLWAVRDVCGRVSTWCWSGKCYSGDDKVEGAWWWRCVGWWKCVGCRGVMLCDVGGCMIMELLWRLKGDDMI